VEITPAFTEHASSDTIRMDTIRGEPLTSGDGEMKVWYEGMTWPVLLSHRVNATEDHGRVAADTFNRVWFSSQAFSRHLLVHHCELVRDEATVIIELGAGCGLVGLCTASAGAKRVFITDLDEALPLLQQNVEDNVKSEKKTIQAARLHWGEVDDVVRLTEHPCFVETEGMTGNLLVLGSDIIWHEQLFEPLLATLVHLADLPLSNHRILSVQIQLASEMRFMADLPGDFAKMAKAVGFEVHESDLDIDGLEEGDETQDQDEYDEANERWIVLHTYRRTPTAKAKSQSSIFEEGRASAKETSATTTTAER
jgi:predicted nicotinamide N-methyase